MEICSQPRPTARSQFQALALNTPFFINFKPSTAISNAQNTSQDSGSSNRSIDDDAVAVCPVPNVQTACFRTRPLFGLARNPGYQLVSKGEDLDPMRSTGGKSTYSLLSDASNESSAFDELNAENNLPNFIGSQENNLISHRTVKFRSESVHNFVTPATRCLVPRSQTTTRFNPFQFDPTKVQREETFDVTTSDYASEMGDSFAGSFSFQNPVYDYEFTNSIHASTGISYENRDEEHRNFALALNNSLATKKYRGERFIQMRATTLSSNVQKNMHPLQVLGNHKDQRMLKSNVICPIQDERSLPTKELFDPQQPSNCKEWCILSIGGRESVHAAAFGDRPLSIWMLHV